MAESMQVDAGSEDFKGTGQCLCGTVQYMISGEPIYSVVCHCCNCRRSTGTSFVTNTIFLKKDLKWQQSKDDALRCFEDMHTDSGTKLMRHFCQFCGSPIFATTPLWDEIVSVFAGTLNDQQAWKPMKEQYCDSKAPWLPDLGVTDRTCRGPGSGAPL
ncbi:hypothetical protein NA57DRAFT_51653 [Rhizodiscina lignyota]|uniref:CENP-V/GFA domain-containing protein n=1 Tax=Rhizodiscina lignyota TaxID=1504668 RepID=A0A9P4INP7_9PEZI|nr:hypothetical protein NA57DRAFT_51653 [Rhizodiscina lignyota]